MRVVYEYPEDAQDGDDFVVEEVDISPTTVTINLKRYTPKYNPQRDQDEAALHIADRLVKELAWETPRPQVLNLLVQAYGRARR